jgi:enamine deaminase RidA (YjgF/YER057c/UK114 family)
MAARQAINRPNFSSPILSEAIIHNGLIYTSGKIGVDAKTGNLVSDDVAKQTVGWMAPIKCLDINTRKKAALGLLESVLLEAGSGLHKIIKVMLTKSLATTDIDKRLVQHLPDEYCLFRSHEHYLSVLSGLSLWKIANNSTDIATIPNPRPARVCVTVAELGRGAKVFIPNYISRGIKLTRNFQRLRLIA